jgi:hypothetical protein
LKFGSSADVGVGGGSGVSNTGGGALFELAFPFVFPDAFLLFDWLHEVHDENSVAPTSAIARRILIATLTLSHRRLTGLPSDYHPHQTPDNLINTSGTLFARETKVSNEAKGLRAANDYDRG